MLIKTLLLSILSCSLLGFSVMDDPTTGGKLLRTQEGVIIIPSSANLNAKDAKALQNILESGGEEIGVLVVNGKITSQNKSITMEDVREMDMSFEEEIIGRDAQLGAFIRIFGRKNKKCLETSTPDICHTAYQWHESAAAELEIARATVNATNDVLDKYGYVEIK